MTTQRDPNKIAPELTAINLIELKDLIESMIVRNGQKDMIAQKKQRQSPKNNLKI